MRDMVPITWAMWDDWRSPNGYMDINGKIPGYRYEMVTYKGQLALYRHPSKDHGKALAVVARDYGEGRGGYPATIERRYCPHFMHPPSRDFKYQPAVREFKMMEVDFTLDELDQAESIITQMG